jgi:hypothetical protein
MISVEIRLRWATDTSCLVRGRMLGHPFNLDNQVGVVAHPATRCSAVVFSIRRPTAAGHGTELGIFFALPRGAVLTRKYRIS